MLKDLAISFGNPVYYNPQSTYYPPGITDDDLVKSPFSPFFVIPANAGIQLFQ